MGTYIVGKLAKPRGAAAEIVPETPVLPSRWRIDGAFSEALRASFEPVIREPVPDRLREMIEKIRIEEQLQRGRKP